MLQAGSGSGSGEKYRIWIRRSKLIYSGSSPLSEAHNSRTTWKNRLTVPLLYTIKTTTPQEYFTLLHETKDQKKSAKTANKYSIFISEYHSFHNITFVLRLMIPVTYFLLATCNCTE